MMKREIDILLVEDNPDHVELTLMTLRKNSVLNEMHVATNGEETIEKGKNDENLNSGRQY